MNNDTFIIKGNIVYLTLDRTLQCKEHAYLICKDRQVEGVYEVLPEQYEDYIIIDYGDQIILPGMTDLHVHAPQYPFRGLGMDLELLEWLETNTFPEEAKYADTSYAKTSYSLFTEDLLHTTTTRACIFATIHNEATLLLMDLLEKSGLKTYVGKVNMDRNGGINLEEESASASYEQTKLWLDACQARYHNTKPILTPRFIPSCTDELMEKLSKLQKEYHLPVQSHLSENLSEIQWVKELVPDSSCYGDAYQMFDLFGGDVPTIMAHCVYSTKEEVALMKKNNVFIAHCPESNLNIASGIAPIRSYLEDDLSVGLGSDVAGGSSLSLLKAMACAIQSSKMYWRLVDQTQKPLTFEDVFYLATLGGGSFFGNVGTFLKGYEFDAVVLNDENIKSPRTLSLQERVNRLIYMPEHVTVVAKYVAGNCLYSDHATLPRRNGYDTIRV